MFIDNELQLVTPFITHVQSEGSNIGGVDPKDYGITRIPGKKQAMLLRTAGNTDSAGKKYPAWLWSMSPRPILSGSGFFQMSYKFALQGNPAGMNVFETDTILIAQCADGKRRKFNLSLQRHIATGQIDIGNWTDTTIKMGPIIQDDPHEVTIQYSFDINKNVCSVLNYECDGIIRGIANNFQNMPATESNWAIGAIPQIQLGSMPSAQAWQIKLWDLEYGWL